MAIRASYTVPKTGATFPTAHIIVQPPVFHRDSRQVTIRVNVYASEADYDAGKDPVATQSRTMDQTAYNTLMGDVRARAEPFLINRFFTDGTRVPD